MKGDSSDAKVVMRAHLSEIEKGDYKKFYEEVESCEELWDLLDDEGCLLERMDQGYLDNWIDIWFENMSDDCANWVF
jgi:hypothetical protein